MAQEVYKPYTTAELLGDVCSPRALEKTPIAAFFAQLLLEETVRKSLDLKDVPLTFDELEELTRRPETPVLLRGELKFKPGALQNVQDPKSSYTMVEYISPLCGKAGQMVRLSMVDDLYSEGRTVRHSRFTVYSAGDVQTYVERFSDEAEKMNAGINSERPRPVWPLAGQDIIDRAGNLGNIAVRYNTTSALLVGHFRDGKAVPINLANAHQWRDITRNAFRTIVMSTPMQTLAE